jgi:uncharacterized protein YdeI (YjbR/CyaY-like superfamily)
MSQSETLYVTERSQWRDWLAKYFRDKKEIWLVYPKKASGKKRIPYNTAVEEALCFDWIDSQVRSLDADHSIQRFTPRKPKSTFSQPNRERLKWLVTHDMIHPDFQQKIEVLLKEEFVFPQDILDAIQADEDAWQHYQSLSEGYKRIRIAYIDSARKRPEEFAKRLRNFLLKTRKGQLIRGHGGIEKYY